MRLHNSCLDSHTFAGRYIIRDPDQWPNQAADGPTAWANYTMIRNLPVGLDVFYVLKQDQDGEVLGESGAETLFSHSFGLRADGSWNAWRLAVTAAGQLGQWGSDEIRAYGLAASLGYTSALPWRPQVTLQFVNGSGDANPNDAVIGTFDGVFGGTDTVLYGWMNLFCWSNIREYRLDLVLSPGQGIKLRGEVHYFTLDEKADAWYYPGKAQRRDKTGASGRELGHEVDLTFSYSFWGKLELRGGWCFFLPGEFIRNTGPAPVAHWGFLQGQVSF
jgi:hypothetical protein